MSRGNKIGVLMIFVIIILGIFLNDEPETIINDKNTYEKSWRLPTSSELGKIGKILIANNIKNCGEYHVKLTHNSYEYLLACTPDGENWTYYVVYTGTEEVFLANEEMEKKLTPPR